MNRMDVMGASGKIAIERSKNMQYENVRFIGMAARKLVSRREKEN